MVKRLTVLIMALLFIASAIPSFASEGPDKSARQAASAGEKPWFQLMADSISGLGKAESGAKEDVTKLFQASHDYIVRTSPGQKLQTLRGNPAEIARRRGQ